MHSDSSIATVSLSSRREAERSNCAQPTPSSAEAKPLVWLGAKSPFGLALPPAKPTQSQLYAPRGVWIDSQRLIVCDSGNHRVLIWNQIPQHDQAPADVVLGQPNFESEGPAAGCHRFCNGLHLPTGVLVVDDTLIVADAWHHRLLVWRQVPKENNCPPDYAIGQASLNQVQPNRGRSCGLNTLYWPYGISYVHGRIYVTDTGNRRVLFWEGVPEADQPADGVLGQASPEGNEENRGGSVNARSFRWPHAVTGDQTQLWIADAGNHRILGWSGRPSDDRDAYWVLGQPNMTRSEENPYQSQANTNLRFPYGLTMNERHLITADTANNRVLFWKLPLYQQAFQGASDLIGQINFDQHGENRWTSVARDSLCWPYGVSNHQNCLAIADSGNNRVMLWDCASIYNQSISPQVNLSEVDADCDKLPSNKLSGDKPCA